jgi:hypothetical protein
MEPQQLAKDMHTMTLDTTKKALAAATKAFTKLPSATNWNTLHEAMEAHQNAHFEAKHIEAYAKFIEQGAAANGLTF